jgi:excinuclease ABC subunit C
MGVVSRLPATPGVYRFRDAGDQVLYIGRATSLRSRVGSYWSDLRKREHLAPMVAAIARVEAVPCACAHEAAWLERNLLEARKPAWNRSAGGQEAEVYIRLTASGLRVTHWRLDPCFGPYLGGLRARQAVRGLRRILPLDDRTEAILHREPGAVNWARTGLERLRDRASDILAFELAARIQEDITALAWITSPQRVTTDAGDFEVRGWHDGVTVRFGFQAGRLREWAQQPGTKPPLSTPDPPATGLAEFAQQTAELASIMLRSA